jgi:hypothetical protein
MINIPPEGPKGFVWNPWRLKHVHVVGAKQLRELARNGYRAIVV